MYDKNNIELASCLRQQGAVILDHLEIENSDLMSNAFSSEVYAMQVELKPAINSYLKQLVASPVRSLADVIAFNRKHPTLVRVGPFFVLALRSILPNFVILVLLYSISIYISLLIREKILCQDNKISIYELADCLF